MLNKGDISASSNRTSVPEMAALHSLLSQALARPGMTFKSLWRSPDNRTEYTLSVISNTNGGDPKWQLTGESAGKRQLLFDYFSVDVLLVHNFITSAATGVSAAQTAAAAQKKYVPETLPPSSPTPVAGKNELQTVFASGVNYAPAPGFSQGDISKTPIDQLLNHLRIAKLTGRLEFKHDQITALIFIRDGIPVDATAGDAEGDDALVELLTWKTGQFVFEPRVLRHSHTVHQPIESLVAQSKQLIERTDYLHKLGLHSNSTLVLKHSNLSDDDFNQIASRNSPVGLDDLNRFYRGLDSGQSVDQLAHTGQTTRGQLMNMIYHLVINGLVKISNPIVLQSRTQLRPRVIDSNAIQSVMMSLRRLETGLFTYPAFLYFFEQEYFRCHRSKTPLSVIVFEARVQTAESMRQSLPWAALLDAVLRVSQLKRHVDLLAHYDVSDYALLLPNTKASGAQIFAKRIVKALSESPLASEVDSSKLSLALGCASMPEDCTDPGELLGAADLAMARSRETKKQVVMYRDIKPISL